MAKKDLSALKARLAKKAGKDADADAVPPPGEQLPEPAAADIPAPGEKLPPPGSADIPAPGQTAPPPQPEPEPEPEPAAGADPLGGGQAFDPNAGIISDTGATEVKPKSNAGALIGVAVAGIAIGAGIGFMLSGQLASGKVKSAGANGGKANLKRIEALKEVRGTISDSIGTAKAAIEEDPDKGSEQLAELLTANFQIFKVDEVFGWQLAALHPDDIESTFRLYSSMSDVVVGLGLLAGFANENHKVLKGGPTKFAVQYNGGGAVLVEFVGYMCGDGDEKTDCDDAAGATAYKIRETLGGPEAVVAKEQASVLVPSPIYEYAIGKEPGQNAKKEYDRLAASLDTKLEKMGALENEVLEAMARFADRPSVDAGSVQPDAGGGGGE